jgi:hypothetical protein
MSSEYLPPESTKLPFNFSRQGYSPASNTSVLFNFALEGSFGTLRAAVNVMQPYWETTHTYAKSCPKYVVGYGSGGVQIIKGRCLFGGIRDLRGIITGLPMLYTVGNLPAYINSVLNASQSDLSSYCFSIKPEDLSAYSGGHSPKNIGGAITGVKKKGLGDFPAFAGGHTPGDIHAYIGVHQSINLHSSITVIKRKGVVDLNGSIDTHLPGNLSSIIDMHRATTLRANIRAYNSIYKYFPAFIHSWTEDNLNSTIDAHRWGSLNAIVGSFGKGVGDLNSYIFVERYKSINNLSSQIDIHKANNLRLSITGVKTEIFNLNSSVHSWVTTGMNAVIDTHLSERLRSSIVSRYSAIKNLRGSIRSWYRENFSNISSIIDMHQPVDLHSFIGMHQPGNLPVIASGHIAGHLWIVLRTWHTNIYKDLHSYIIGWQQGNMSAYLGGDLPIDLRVYLRAWQRNVPLNFPVFIHSWENSPNLDSSINIHQPESIRSAIRGWGISQKNLNIILHSWQINNLTSYIATHPYNKIRSSIKGWFRNASKNMSGAIKGWQFDSLSSVVDTHIWGVLGATVFPHPPPPIYATIRGWAVKQQKDLHANMHGWQGGNLGAISGGHKYGALNIILKSVHISVIKDITAIVHGWQMSDLGMIIKGGHLPSDLGILLKGVVVGTTKDLYANARGWQQTNLGVTTKGGHRPQNITAYVNIFQSIYKNLKSSIRGWIENSIPAIIGGHLYEGITSSIRPWYIEKFKNLSGHIYGWDKLELQSAIGTHAPATLRGLVKPSVITNKLFPAHIHSWQQVNLNMTLGGTHDPIKLFAQLQAKQRRSTILPASIYAWHERYLLSSLNIVFPYDLQAIIYLIPPSDLSGYLKARFFTSLPSRIYGWQDYNLSANIHQIWSKNLLVSIYGRMDTKKNLSSKIKGYGSEYQDLYGHITAFQWNSLNAILRATYLSSIHAYLFAVAPKNLYGHVHAWHERFLQGILNGQNYPWNLTAQIYPKGNWATFTANILPRKDREIYGDLVLSVHPWDIRSFTAYITGSNAPALSAYLNPLGHANDLHGSIRPKMIRLTTIISIPTQIHSNISATINYPCFRTGYSFLSSSIYTKYKGDLYAYIKPIFYNYKPKSLSAKTGYTDAYLEVDKLKLSINIHPSEFFTEDKVKLLLSLLDADSLLTAYIRGTLRYNGISAQIVCDTIPSYTFGTVLQNREIVVNKTYDQIFKTFEVVELAFKSAVKDYFFSSAGGFAWKSDRYDRWIFDVRSILPPDVSLGTIRRLHKATTIYDLKKFRNIDDAVRAAITYVTEYPQSTLSASIINLGTYKTLSSIIVPRYIINSKNSLESTITPVGNVVLINEKESITKI